MLAVVARFEGQTVRCRVPDGEASVGSALANDFVLPFPGVSRRHATLTWCDGVLTVRDAGSKNGLFVGAKRVGQASLRAGEFVRLGRALLSIEDSPSAEVELAFELNGGAPRDRGATAELVSAATADTGAAFHLAREIYAASKLSGRRRQNLLSQLCEVLAARSIVFYSIGRDGEACIHNVARDLMVEDVLVDAARVVTGKRRLTTGRWSGPHAIAIVSGANSARLAVFFEQTQDIPDWASNLVELVAQRLTLPDEEIAPPPDPEVRGLSIPETMVVGSSEAMRSVVAQIAATVGSRLNVLLLGETGTGKELFARMIHASGPTAGGPFIAVNCAAIPAELLEAELFGVQARVATGVDPRIGLFTQADGGSILLDEIGDMPPALQAKLLRVLQEREVLPVGGSRPRRIDVRVIAASNRNIEDHVRAGQFRADVYYRLRGLQFHIPPLRDRKDDLADLSLAFVQRAANDYGRSVRGITRSALQILLDHDWPGNVRELESEIRRAVLVCPDGCAIQTEHLGTVRWKVKSRVDAFTAADPPSERDEDSAEASGTLRESIEDAERRSVLSALRRANGNQSEAARILGVSRNGLRMKMMRLGINARHV